ncbi:MAG: prmC [Burkholderiales bacterium]|jgi:release factor glutamine methyltransferase|nr:prmC [Burkholderiales bacterium]
MKESIKQILQNSKLSKLDTKILLGHILGFSKVELVTCNDYQLNEEQYDSYLELYDKCLHGMPIAYILGYKEFYSHKFRVTPDTLIPRPETELLVDMVLQLAKPGDRILDLGTGSGCIAISCKLENKMLDITATDMYAQTLMVAKDNAITLGAEIRFIQSDWFNNIDGIYDIIVSNPPYIVGDDDHLRALAFEPQHALTDFADGMSNIKKIITTAQRHLQGYLLLEHGYDQGRATLGLMQNNGYKNVRTIKDYAGQDRITLGKIG